MATPWRSLGTELAYLRRGLSQAHLFIVAAPADGNCHWLLADAGIKYRCLLLLFCLLTCLAQPEDHYAPWELQILNLFLLKLNVSDSVIFNHCDWSRMKTTTIMWSVSTNSHSKTPLLPALTADGFQVFGSTVPLHQHARDKFWCGRGVSVIRMELGSIPSPSSAAPRREAHPGVMQATRLTAV